MSYYQDVFIPRTNTKTDPVGALKYAIESEKQFIACLEKEHALLNIKISNSSSDSESAPTAKDYRRWGEIAEVIAKIQRLKRGLL